MDTLQFHDMTLTWLDGGVTSLDGGAMFGVVPKPLWTRKYPVNEKNQIECSCEPILIQYEGKNYLIDTGLGNKLSDKLIRNFGVTEPSKVTENLQQLNLSVNDIDAIFVTHLHFDHAGGLTRFEGETIVPTFPNAKIYVTQIEWDEMKEPNIRSKSTYWKENWEPIQHLVQTYTGSIEVAPGIEMIHTGGHSEGHAIIKITRNGETLIHMADIFPTHAHQNPLWVMAYDDYPMTSIYAKDKYFKEAYKNGYKFIFYHDAYYRMIQWDESGKEIVDCLKRGKVAGIQFQTQ